MKRKILLFIILLSLISFSITSNDFYFENQEIFSLKEYKNQKRFSKEFLRNLIAYYYYDKPKQLEVKEFLRQFPEFYWIVEQLWEQNPKPSSNPALKVWEKYLSVLKTQEYDYKDLINDCHYFGEMFCSWLTSLQEIYTKYYKIKKPLSLEDYTQIYIVLEDFINKNYYIPFMYQTGKWLPDYLRSIGLNLEAALLIKNMMYRTDPNIQKQLRSDFYLSLLYAGDIESFIKKYWSDPKESSQQFPLVSIFNVMILSKNFSFLIKVLQNEQNIEFLKKQKGTDLWTGLPITEGLIRIRHAELYFWGTKNEKETLILLDKIQKNKSITELEKQYARLIQSRILYGSNINLAQKIAEDVQFKSQEKGFYLLEYYATLWNGWCLYKMQKYYQSTIEFVKAANIHKKHLSNKSQYGVLLGLLLSKRKFGITESEILETLEKIHQQYIPDPYFFSVMEWIPTDIHYDIWKDIYIDFLYEQKRYRELLNLIYKDYIKSIFFHDNQNPSSVLGMYSSYLYCKYLQCANVVSPIRFYQSESFPSFSNSTPIVLFLQTTKYLHGFIIQNSKIIRKRIENKENKKNFVQMILNEKRPLIFILNPHVELTHKEFDTNSDQHRFVLLYRNPDGISAIKSKLSFQQEQEICKQSSKTKTGIFIYQNWFINENYPLLSKIQCSQETIRLWDLQRFWQENQVFYYKEISHPKMLRMLYYISMIKNWYLIEQTDQEIITFEPIENFQNN
ncbi:MAG: hypothetical protein NZ853_07705 [Leptospiraceae bacterium]|nr:hypothetical protein [Leptospiraceae bacterium]MDW7975680.1 hypothetical protein [Leptospiraceae bacterium]